MRYFIFSLAKLISEEIQFICLTRFLSVHILHSICGCTAKSDLNSLCSVQKGSSILLLLENMPKYHISIAKRPLTLPIVILMGTH